MEEDLPLFFVGIASNYYTERRKTRADEREVASMAILADRGRGGGRANSNHRKSVVFFTYSCPF
jgi:hypothetical protein